VGRLMQDDRQGTAMTGKTDAIFGRKKSALRHPLAVAHLGAGHSMFLKDQIDLILALCQRH